MSFDRELLIKEFNFKAIRSSGSGGQHANKVASKIELTFNLEDSKVFNEEQKEQLKRKLKSRLTKENYLIVYCEATRSQHKNKAQAIERIFTILKDGLKVNKPRKPTKVPRAVIKKRLKNKRLQSERKLNRKKPNLE